MNNHRITLDDILNSVMREEGEPNYLALQRWSDRYPEFRDALAEFFATWAVQIELREDSEVDEENLANRLVSHALSLLHRKQEAIAHSPPPHSTSTRLIATAKTHGITAAELARRTRLDEDIIAKFDLRRVTGVPRLCLLWLKTAVGSADNYFGLMVTGSPILAQGVSYKSKKRPEPKTEDFVDSIRNSSLSDEDKQFWYDVVAADRAAGGAA